MKHTVKYAVSALLLLVMVLTVFPVFSVPAAAAKGDDELTYDDLIVEDGLVTTFTPSNSTVDLEAGTWTSDDNLYTATIVQPEWWTIKGKSLGYTMTQAELNANYAASNNGGVGITMPSSLLNEEEFTVDIVLSAIGPLTEEGERSYTTGGWGNYRGNSTFIDIGPMRSMQFGGHDKYTIFVTRWFYDTGVWNDHGSKAGMGIIDTNSLSFDAQIKHFSMSYKKLAEDTANFILQTNGTQIFDYNSKTSTAASGYWGNRFFPIASAPFRFLHQYPGTVYSVRVYNRELTASEQIMNGFASLCKLYSASLDEFAALSDEGRLYVAEKVLAKGFDTKKATIEADIAAYAADYRAIEEKRAEEEAVKQELLASLEGRNTDTYLKYYVQKGLVAFLDGFVGLEEWNTNLDIEAGTWKSLVGDVTATITGTEWWSTNVNGKGIGYRLTLAQFDASKEDGKSVQGIELPTELLSMQFTVETVAQFVGLTNADGTRYEDPVTTTRGWGIYTDKHSTFSFGALKTMTFVCTSHGSHGTPMGFRWCYTPKEWGEHNGSEGYQDDTTIYRMDPAIPTTMTITKVAPNDAIANVAVYYGSSNTATISRSYTAINDRNPEFNLFKGLPATVYAIRYYNRPLSNTERAQNHMADLLSYYGLDTSLLDLVLTNLSNPDSFYPLFNSIGFDLSKEEAQEAFTNCLSGCWLSGLGVSGRLDGKTALRFAYTLNPEAIAAMEAAGYKMNIGAVVNVGGDVAPTLEANQFKTIFRDEDGNLNNAFLIRENVFGISVRYNCPTPLMSISEIYCLGFVELIYPDGSTQIFYLENNSESYDNNLFSYYENLRANAGYMDSAFVNEVVDNSFEKKELFVDAEGGDNAADGETEATAVKTIERAYELLLELLENEVPVNVTMSFASGKYVPEAHLILDGDEISQKYFRLTLKGEEDDSSIVTTNREFDGSGWSKVEGMPYYEYQFEPDAEGKYPYFRFLYVNGAVQEVAHQGFNRTYEAELAGGFDKMFKVKEQFDGVDNDNPNPEYKLYVDPAAVASLTQTDIDTGKVEFHMPIAWYYRVIHVVGVDTTDVAENGDVALYLKADEMQRWSAQHKFKGHYYWLQNAASFVDEPGEYFYDFNTGRMIYYPAEGVDMASATFEYPTGNHMLSFLDVDFITLDHMVFTGNNNDAFDTGAYLGGQATTAHGAFGSDTMSAVYFSNTSSVTVKNCLFHDLATTGLQFNDITKLPTVDTNRFYNIGCTAISFGSHSGTWDETRHCNIGIKVLNNHLDNIAWLTRGSTALYISVSRDTEVAYNTIMNTSYTGVSIGWRWSPADWAYGTYTQTEGARLHHNYFRDVMTDQSDGGGIYTLGGNAANDYHEYFNFMYENYFWFTEKCWDGQGMVMPYYHDGASSNWRTYSNVLILNPYRKVHTSIYVQNIIEQYTHNIHVEYNEIVAAYKDWETFDGGWDLDPIDQEYAIFGEDGNHPIPDYEQPNYGFRKYYSRIDFDRDLSQSDNYNYDHPLDIEGTYVVEMIEATGSEFFKPDAYEMFETMAPIYDDWYTDLEEAYINS